MSNNDHKDILETKRVEIIQSLNFERKLLLNYLRSNHVFDEEDFELIMAEKANRARAGKLIDFLLKKGSQAYQHFLDVFQVENATLYEFVTGHKATERKFIMSLLLYKSCLLCLIIMFILLFF